jgi:uncharacterized protein
MIAKDILKQIVLQQRAEGFSIKETVKRELLAEVLKWFEDPRIMILTGMRRSGKSTLLKQIMQVKNDYCYVNFDDERFLGFTARDFEQLNEVLIEYYGDRGIYFFDEIQNIEKFETFVRRLQDQGKKVVITGSNASLLSRELGTRLTGRYKSFELFPFSFREYLVFKGVQPEKDWVHVTGKKVKIIKLFEDYRVEGGLPEYLKYRDSDYVKTVFENILYRDIIARYSLKGQKILKELVNILATNISCPFTYNSLKNTLGLSNAMTVKEYISYLCNSYLFFEQGKFDYSVKKQANYPKKIYLIDTAFNRIAGFNFSMDKGKLLENIVFMELKRGNKDTYYYSDKNECDFVVKEKTSVMEAIQVCSVLREGNRKREIGGLTEAMEKFELKEGVLLTLEQEDEILVDGRKIHIFPVWKWLLRFTGKA